ncbi:MAG: YopX family protein [Bacteroidales bacterium]|nr:YopX family protein [Bacteroidales bacterium]
MRTIKFRGKDNKGKWLYGDLLHWHGAEDNPWIQTGAKGQFNVMKAIGRCVVPETVGQFTGLLDRNGKEIYEGDVFTFGRLTGIITWHPDGYWCIHTSRSEIEYCSYNTLGEMIKHLNSNNIEYGVIGNIHDNPELIKEVAI